MSRIINVRPSLNTTSTIQDIMSIDSRDSFIELLSEITSKLRLKHFWHMVAPNQFKPQNQELTAINNFPKEFEEGYIRTDKHALNCPVLHYAYQFSQEPVLWRDMINFSALSDEQHRLMEWYSGYGINTGICFPIHEPGNKYAVLTFILDENQNLSEEELNQVKQYLYVLSNLIHQKYRFFLEGTINNKTPPLAPRESECLIWAAKGKSVWETAIILGLSQYTVREYLVNAMKKLGVQTKTAAISKAILTNQILYTDFVST